MSEPLFVADSLGHMRLVELDGLTAIYHRRSGQTHIVSEPLPEILAALGRESLTTAALLTRLTESADVSAGREALAARLAELEATGLVERR